MRCEDLNEHKGKWVSPCIAIDADTEFTAPDKRLKPKIFNSTTTPVTLYRIPCWSLTMALTLLSIFCETVSKPCRFSLVQMSLTRKA
jgi:hypothetical protein